MTHVLPCPVLSRIIPIIIHMYGTALFASLLAILQIQVLLNLSLHILDDLLISNQCPSAWQLCPFL